VVLFKQRGGAMESIMAGDIESHDKLLEKVKKATHKLERGPDGMFGKGRAPKDPPL
jgi:hypothetical protein